METQTEAADCIKERLDELGIPVREFALEARLFLPEAYAIAKGRILVGPVRQARVEAAMQRLELKYARLEGAER